MISVILLAGGKGERMGGPLPKQFLPLAGKPLVLRSLDLFFTCGVDEVIVVCAPSLRSYFTGYDVAFAEPGVRRQDSLYSGLQQARGNRICTHDAARPLITLEKMRTVLAHEGPAALAVPVKSTVREADKNGCVTRSLDRDSLYEVQTPQMIPRQLLEEGFAIAQERQITVTDDVALAELAGATIHLLPGEYSNLKVTTPEDLLIAERLYAQVSSDARV